MQQLSIYCIGLTVFLRTYFDAASNAAPADEMVPYSVAFASSNDFTELALPSGPSSEVPSITGTNLLQN